MGPFNPHGFGLAAGGRIISEVIAGLFFIVLAVIVIGVLFFLVRFLIVSTRAAEIYIREHEQKADTAPVSPPPPPPAAAVVDPVTPTKQDPVTPTKQVPVKATKQDPVTPTKQIPVKAPPRPRTPKAPPTP